MSCKVILIGGGSASGKTYVLSKVLEKFGDQIALVSLDDYYKDFSNLPFEERTKINWDHPKSFDLKLIHEQISHLKNGTAIEKPIYDFTIHGRSG